MGKTLAVSGGSDGSDTETCVDQELCFINHFRLDFEPKTSSDFVDNLDLLDTIEETITDLKVTQSCHPINLR